MQMNERRIGHAMDASGGTSIIAVRDPGAMIEAGIMALLAAESEQQAELRKRVEQLRELFANDPDIVRIDYRFAKDWSGEDSIFIDVVLRMPRNPPEVITRLTGEIDKAVLDVVRSEELDFHAYPSFVSRPGNGRHAS
jgi:hypothetical protein